MKINLPLLAINFTLIAVVIELHRIAALLKEIARP